MPDPDFVRFDVMMQPIGKGRARVTKSGHAYTPQQTVHAENAIREAWREQSGVMLPPGPIQLLVTCLFGRPKGHYTPAGKLNKVGRESFAPTKRPDLDNILKLVSDALNGYAWTDDALIVFSQISKLWADDYPLVKVYAAPAGVLPERAVPF